MESSKNNIFASFVNASLGSSFILATKSRVHWLCGMKLRGHVGVYFTKGRL